MFKSFACQSNMTKKKELIVALIFTVIVFICFSIITSSSTLSTNDHTAKKQDTANCTQAFIISQNYIEQYLKSPSSAKYNEYRCTEQKDNSGLKVNEFIINSNVDAQNSFGSMINSHYSVNAKYLGGDWAEIKNWELYTILLDGEIVYSTKE